MLRRIFRLLLVVGLVTGTLWAADDPFVGKWKVNPSKSKLTDEMKVEAVGANKYTFTFGPGQVDTIVADGSDQPALQGTTLSVTVEGPNNWKVVRKMKGRTLLTAYWTLSEDGKTLHDAFTQYLPSGMALFSVPLPLAEKPIPPGAPCSARVAVCHPGSPAARKIPRDGCRSRWQPARPAP